MHLEVGQEPEKEFLIAQERFDDSSQKYPVVISFKPKRMLKYGGESLLTSKQVVLFVHKYT